MNCVLFGHHNAAFKIIDLLREICIDLIENKKITCFYIGCQGCFDMFSADLLRELVKKYPHVDYCVVLAYMPTNTQNIAAAEKSIYPFSLESVPKNTRLFTEIVG